MATSRALIWLCKIHDTQWSVTVERRMRTLDARSRPSNSIDTNNLIMMESQLVRIVLPSYASSQGRSFEHCDLGYSLNFTCCKSWHCQSHERSHRRGLKVLDYGFLWLFSQKIYACRNPVRGRWISFHQHREANHERHGATTSLSTS
jgi:hypothetical protein